LGVHATTGGVATEGEVASDEGDWGGRDWVGGGADDYQLAAAAQAFDDFGVRLAARVVERITLDPPIFCRASPGLPEVESM
jgi:hypothetical protein